MSDRSEFVLVTVDVELAVALAVGVVASIDIFFHGAGCCILCNTRTKHLKVGKQSVENRFSSQRDVINALTVQRYRGQQPLTSLGDTVTHSALLHIFPMPFRAFFPTILFLH